MGAKSLATQPREAQKAAREGALMTCAALATHYIPLRLALIDRNKSPLTYTYKLRGMRPHDRISAARASNGQAKENEPGNPTAGHDNRR